jgi:hypothetical protein
LANLVSLVVRLFSSTARTPIITVSTVSPRVWRVGGGTRAGVAPGSGAFSCAYSPCQRSSGASRRDRPPRNSPTLNHYIAYCNCLSCRLSAFVSRDPSPGDGRARYGDGRIPPASFKVGLRNRCRGEHATHSEAVNGRAMLSECGRDRFDESGSS